jgi:hypothetical protein
MKSENDVLAAIDRAIAANEGAYKKIVAECIPSPDTMNAIVALGASLAEARYLANAPPHPPTDEDAARVAGLVRELALLRDRLARVENALKLGSDNRTGEIPF